MKVLTWNCNGALRKKLSSVTEFDADIVIIQECENPETTKDKAYRDWSNNYLWTGENNNKGLGIFAASSVKITRLNWNSGGLKYFIACNVNNKFNLLGTWCHGTDSSSFAYIGQLWKYLQLHKVKLGKCVIAGDFNSNVIWDKPRRQWNHSDVVRELKDLEIESLYHVHFKEQIQGKELTPTFFLQKNLNKPYHLDYIFASEQFHKTLKSISIGHPDTWLDKSDHMPVFCEI